MATAALAPEVDDPQIRALAPAYVAALLTSA